MSTIRRFILLAVLLLAPAPAFADEKGIPGVQADGFAVATVNVARLWDAESLKPFREAMEQLKEPLTGKFEKETGLKLEELERATIYSPGFSIEKNETQPFTILTTRKPFDRAKIIKSFKAQSAAELTDKLLADQVKGIAGKNVYFFEREVLIFADDRTVIIGPMVRQLEQITAFLKVLDGTTPKVVEGSLAEALAAVGKHTAVVALDLAPVRKLLEGEGEIREPFKPFQTLSQAERGLITLDIDTGVKTAVKLTFFDAETAEKAEPNAKTIIALAGSMIDQFRKQKGRDAATDAVLLPLLDFGKAALGKGGLKLDGKTLTATAGGEIDAPMKKALAAFPAWAEAETARLSTANNLKQIAIALHSYHDVMGAMPQDIVDKNGKPILSWRVHMLPYMEQTALHNQLDLTKPWDDAANKKFVEQMPKVFEHFARPTKEKGYTHFQMLTAEKALPAGNPFLVPGRKLTLSGIPDGSSNTLMVVEGEAAVNWLKPGDVAYDPKKPPKLGNPKTGKFVACLGDGSVRWFDLKKLAAKDLHALGTTDGGEVVKIDD